MNRRALVRNMMRVWERDDRAIANTTAADKWRAVTGGANRQTRRDAYRATRRRNDGRLKKMAAIVTKVRSAR